MIMKNTMVFVLVVKIDQRNILMQIEKVLEIFENMGMIILEVRNILEDGLLKL